MLVKYVNHAQEEEEVQCVMMTWGMMRVTQPSQPRSKQNRFCVQTRPAD